MTRGPSHLDAGLPSHEGPSLPHQSPQSLDMGLSRRPPQPGPVETSPPLGPDDSNRQAAGSAPPPAASSTPLREVRRRPSGHGSGDGLDGASGGLGNASETLSPPPERAPDIPLTGVGPGIRAILHKSAPPAAAVLFECINRLQALARDTQTLRLYEESIIASNLAGRLAVKTIELTIGKDVNIHATIHNQSHIPKWESLPQAVRDRFLEAIHQVPQQATAQLLEEPIEQSELVDHDCE